MDILQTTNPTRGFHGAFSHHAADPSAAWPLAMKAIAKATDCPAEDVRTFLDSRQGRLFAEAVIESMSTNALATAVDAAVARWMYLKIGKDESDHGPAGSPYLTGFVCHCELEADSGP